MFIRRITNGCIVAVIALSVTEANAVANDDESDGCSVLRQVVAAHVNSLSNGAPGILQVMRALPDPQWYCAATAASVSMAFGGAMHEAGIVVRWRPGPVVPIDYCMDHYLPRCYPIISPPGGSAMAQELSFVHDAWKAVTRSVMDVMPYGVGSDMAVFDSTTLGRSLAGNLKFELSFDNKAGRATR